jgi:hypothetical protein
MPPEKPRRPTFSTDRTSDIQSRRKCSETPARWNLASMPGFCARGSECLRSTPVASKGTSTRRTTRGHRVRYQLRVELGFPARR